MIIADATYGNATYGSIAYGEVSQSRLIIGIDGDSDVRAGQVDIAVVTLGMDASPTVKTASLGGQPLVVVSAGETGWVVSVPAGIALKWGETYQLVLTDDSGSVLLNNVTLSPEAGWQFINFSGTIPSVSTKSGYEVVKADYAYDMLAGDQWLFKSEIGLSFNVETVAALNPQRTITTEYRVWNDTLATMSAKTSYNVAQKPKLSSGGFNA